MYIRAGYLAVLTIVLLALLLVNQTHATNLRALSASAASAFEIVAYLQLGLICIIAPVFMAGAIAQESNAQTWDILLTTPMSAVQIVLGQIFGRLFFVLALLIASLPLFAITQYFGGVPGSSVFESYLVSASMALLVGVVAVTLSVNRLAGRRAVFTFYVSVVTYLAITFVLDAFIRQRSGDPGVTVMTPLNPFLALQSLLNPAGYPTPSPVALQEMGAMSRLWFGNPVLAWGLVTVGLSVVLGVLSVFRVRSIGTRSAVPWYRGVFRLGAEGGVTRPARSVSQNPIAWREATARMGTLPKLLARWSFIVLGLLWGLGILVYFHVSGVAIEDFRLILLATVLTEFAVLTLVAINMAATAISREREDGTLDLLLTTPITPKDYLGGKLRGLIGYLMPLLAVPVLTLLLTSAYVAVGGFGRPGGVEVSVFLGQARANVPMILPEAGLIFPVVTVPFLAFCVMIGLQWSLKSKGTLASVVATVAVVGIAAGAVGGCGWQAARSIPLVGPALAALNPLTALIASTTPADAYAGFLEGIDDLTSARIALGVGAGMAVAIYLGVVLGMRASMTRTFDMTTRKLAGMH